MQEGFLWGIAASEVRAVAGASGVVNVVEVALRELDKRLAGEFPSEQEVAAGTEAASVLGGAAFWLESGAAVWLESGAAFWLELGAAFWLESGAGAKEDEERVHLRTVVDFWFGAAKPVV